MALTPDGQEQKNTAKRGGGLPLTAKGNILAVLTALAAILLGAFSLRGNGFPVRHYYINVSFLCGFARLCIEQIALAGSSPSVYEMYRLRHLPFRKFQ